MIASGTWTGSNLHIKYCDWEIDDNGVLTITRKNTYEEYLPSIISASDCPWYSYKGQVQKVVFGAGIKTNMAFSHVFGGYSFLKEADLSELGYHPNQFQFIGVFENCSNLEKVIFPSNPSLRPRVNLSGLFRECYTLSNIQGNLFGGLEEGSIQAIFLNCYSLAQNLSIDSLNSFDAFDNPEVFRGTTQNIYLLDNGTVNNSWKNIAAQYSNVHYGVDDNSTPSFTYEITRQTAESGEIIIDEGEILKINITNIQTYENYIPYNWSNYLRYIDIYLDGTSVYHGDINIEPEEFTYFINTGDTNQHTVSITLTDSVGHTTTKTQKVIGVFALLEFRAGGKGMSIGKISERNGLDIAFPTMIGEGLIPAMDQGDSSEVDLTNYQLVVGQYNEEEPDAYIIVGDGTSEERKNIFEVRKDGYIKVGDGLMGVSTGIKEFTVWCYQASTEHPDPTPQLQLKRKDNIDTEASLTSFMLNIGRTNLHLQEAPAWTTLWNVDMTKIAKLSNKTKTTFNPTSGSSWANYGGCYYEVYGQFVHVHLGIGSLTANTNTVVYTLPSSIQPDTMIFGTGIGNNISTMSRAHISTSGVITVNSAATYCGIELYYLI